MDVSPTILGDLVIHGKLEFKRGNDLVLSCMTILVWGDLEVGTQDKPFLSSARITLRGTRLSPTLVADNEYYLGSKIMAVFGSISMVGKPRLRAWTRLAVTADAGSTNLLLDEPVDWSEGDELVISATEFNRTHTETVKVAPFFGVGTIKLDAPLQYLHFGGTIKAGNQSIKLGAAVGLLTHNVIIEVHI
jgi:hypothetical protein